MEAVVKDADCPECGIWGLFKGNGFKREVSEVNCD